MDISRALRLARRVATPVLARPEMLAAKRYRAATSRLEGASAFDGLQPQSLAVASVRPRPASPSINLVLPELSVSAMFAGVRTALGVGLELGDRLGRPLRLVGLKGSVGSNSRRSLFEYITHEFARPESSVSAIISATDLHDAAIGLDDIWIATHWTTAHSLDVASRLGVVAPSSVVYLVQDYEPGFTPWSTSYALARATYHAGFVMIVNSRPLRDYLSRVEMVHVPDELVFHPQLDLARLERTAERRGNRRGGQATVLFYSRPDKPRNLYAIGMSALSLAALRELRRGHTFRVQSVGARHPRPAAGALTRMDILGKLTWEAYFDALAESDIMLSLQHSPHPSHPPLDTVVSGGLAVTNELDGTRAGLHPHLLVAEPDPEALSETIRGALDRVRDGKFAAGYSPGILRALGSNLDEVVSDLSKLVSG